MYTRDGDASIEDPFAKTQLSSKKPKFVVIENHNEDPLSIIENANLSDKI